MRKIAIILSLPFLTGCADESQMLAPDTKPDFVYDTSSAPEDVRDCIVNLHFQFNSMEETKQEIVFSAVAIKGFYPPYFVIRIRPAGKGSHIDVHLGLGGSIMYKHGGQECLDKLPPT